MIFYPEWFGGVVGVLLAAVIGFGSSVLMDVLWGSAVSVRNARISSETAEEMFGAVNPTGRAV